MHSCHFPFAKPEYRRVVTPIFQQCFDIGGELAHVDLGDVSLVLLGGIARAKAELKSVLHLRYDIGLAAIDDPDLADQ